MRCGWAYGIFSSQADAESAIAGDRSRTSARRIVSEHRRPLNARHRRRTWAAAIPRSWSRSTAFHRLPGDATRLHLGRQRCPGIRRWSGDHRICCEAGRLAARVWRTLRATHLRWSASSSSTRAAGDVRVQRDQRPDLSGHGARHHRSRDEACRSTWTRRHTLTDPLEGKQAGGSTKEPPASISPGDIAARIRTRCGGCAS